MKSNYKRSIKALRLKRLAQMLEQSGYSDVKSLVEAVGAPAAKALVKSYLMRIMSIQNSTRGKLGELMGEISITAMRPQSANNDIIRDQIIFETPLGKRRIDVFDPSNNSALETKMGRICASKFVRQQIAKDRYLLDTKKLSDITWLCFYGASSNVQKKLENAGINYREGWPDIPGCSGFSRLR